MIRRTVFQKTLLLIVVLAALALGAFLLFSKSSSSPQTSNPSVPESSTPQPPVDAPDIDTPQKTYPVSVYFSKHPESDNDPSATFPIPRTAPDSGVGKFAIAELLKGPTESEKAAGYFSYARVRESESTCGGADFKLTINEGTATLQFCRQFDHIGSVSDGQAESVLKATLMQFSTVDKVIILDSKGDCQFNASGLNLCKE